MSGFSAITKIIEKLPGPLKEVPSCCSGHCNHGDYGDGDGDLDGDYGKCGNGDLDEVMMLMTNKIILTLMAVMIIVIDKALAGFEGVNFKVMQWFKGSKTHIDNFVFRMHYQV